MYPRGLIDPKGSCPWAGPWARSYGAHLRCRSPGSKTPPANAASLSFRGFLRLTTAKSKPALRAEALARRDALSNEARAEASIALAARCWPLIAEYAPKSLAGYFPMRSECDVRPILAAADEEGIDVALPVILPGRSLVFRRYDPLSALIAGGFGTSMPDSNALTIDPELIIVPVVGFDRQGTRLGYGAGHYDRTIAAMHAAGRRPPLIGVAFAAQEVDTIPHESHDIRLDLVVTEKEVMDFRDVGRPER
jgi:5-formyltetrahydrofolate cyclo-ligase